MVLLQWSTRTLDTITCPRTWVLRGFNPTYKTTGHPVTSYVYSLHTSHVQETGNEGRNEYLTLRSSLTLTSPVCRVPQSCSESRSRFILTMSILIRSSTRLSRLFGTKDNFNLDWRLYLSFVTVRFCILIYLLRQEKKELTQWREIVSYDVVGIGVSSLTTIFQVQSSLLYFP